MVCSRFQSRQIIWGILIFELWFWINRQSSGGNASKILQLLYCIQLRDQMIFIQVFANICTNHTSCMDWTKGGNFQCQKLLISTWNSYQQSKAERSLPLTFGHCWEFFSKHQQFFYLFIACWTRIFYESTS